MPTDSLDVSGLPCPQPVAALRRRLTGLEHGESVVVVGETAATEASIRRACETHGYNVVAVERAESATAADPDTDGFALRVEVTEFASL